jgi:hypothetical protein
LNIPVIDDPDLVLPRIAGEECLTGSPLVLPVRNPEECIVAGEVGPASPTNPLRAFITDYWPCDDNTGADRIDAIGSHPLLDGTGNWPKVTGQISGAVGAYPGGVVSGLLALQALATGTLIIGEGVPFTLTCWVQRTGGAQPTPGGPGLLVGEWPWAEPGNFGFILGNTGDGDINFEIIDDHSVSSLRAGVSLPNADTDWHFLAGGYDIAPGAHQFQPWIQLDNGARQYPLSGTSLGAGSRPIALRVLKWAPNSGGNDTDFTFAQNIDEIGLYRGISLSTSQVDFLWNSGAGQRPY